VKLVSRLYPTFKKRKPANKKTLRKLFQEKLFIAQSLPHLSSTFKDPKREEKMVKKELEVVKDVDLERYMGRWYEIASFPSFFVPKNGADTRATYTLNQDGTVHVLNETWSDGKRVAIEGSAYKADPKSNESKLKVKFYVPPFLPIIPVVGNYWVLYLDGEYQYALIGEPTRKYLWVCPNTLHLCSLYFIVFRFTKAGHVRVRVREFPSDKASEFFRRLSSVFQILCRKTHLEDEIYEMLVQKAKDEGYDPSKLRKTPQSDPPPEGGPQDKGTWWLKSLIGK